jgi:hypothetical protein
MSGWCNYEYNAKNRGFGGGNDVFVERLLPWRIKTRTYWGLMKSWRLCGTQQGYFSKDKTVAMEKKRFQLDFRTNSRPGFRTNFGAGFGTGLWTGFGTDLEQCGTVLEHILEQVLEQVVDQVLEQALPVLEQVLVKAFEQVLEQVLEQAFEQILEEVLELALQHVLEQF